MIEPVISYLLGNCSYSTETQYLAFDSDRWDRQTDSLTIVYMTRLKPRENDNDNINKVGLLQCDNVELGWVELRWV